MNPTVQFNVNVRSEWKDFNSTFYHFLKVPFESRFLLFFISKISFSRILFSAGLKKRSNIILILVIFLLLLFALSTCTWWGSCGRAQTSLTCDLRTRPVDQYSILAFQHITYLYSKTYFSHTLTRLSLICKMHFQV